MRADAGVFARLPASPIYAEEEIELHVYAHTRPYALDTWTVCSPYPKSYPKP